MQPPPVNPYLLLALGHTSMPGVGAMRTVDRPGPLTSDPNIKPGVGATYESKIPGVSFDAQKGWQVLGMPWWLALGLGLGAYLVIKG